VPNPARITADTNVVNRQPNTRDHKPEFASPGATVVEGALTSTIAEPHENNVDHRVTEHDDLRPAQPVLTLRVRPGKRASPRNP
jgi:hypothetical protein